MALPRFLVLFLFLISESVHNPSNLRDVVDAAGELPRSSLLESDHYPDVTGSQLPLLYRTALTPTRTTHLHHRAMADD